MLSPEALERAAAQIMELAKEAGVNVALVGGFALQQYGSPRLTGDIDVIADGDIPALPRKRWLTFGGKITQAPNGVPVDLILRSDDYAGLYEEALLQARKRRGKMAIIRPEYLFVMKMAAERTQDTADMEFLVVEKIIDLEKTRAIIRCHLGLYAAHVFDSFVAETLWKVEQGLL